MSGPVLKRELQKDCTQIGEHRCGFKVLQEKNMLAS
jgi:hypothetical protein